MVFARKSGTKPIGYEKPNAGETRERENKGDGFRVGKYIEIIGEEREGERAVFAGIRYIALVAINGSETSCQMKRKVYEAARARGVKNAKRMIRREARSVALDALE